MKSEEIKKLVAKSENVAVEFRRARGDQLCRKISCGMCSITLEELKKLSADDEGEIMKGSRR